FDPIIEHRPAPGCEGAVNPHSRSPPVSSWKATGSSPLFSRRLEKPRKIRGRAATNQAEMTETTPQPKSDGPAGRPVGIDWAAALAENDRWLRTAVLARLGERQA